MDIESLYPLVTEAIRRAEIFDDLNAPGARDAHRDVSLLEEQIATLLPASNTEGAIARRGAVRAAIAAGDFQRAEALAARFSADADTNKSLRRELGEMAKEASRAGSKVGRPDAGRVQRGTRTRRRTRQPPANYEPRQLRPHVITREGISLLSEQIDAVHKELGEIKSLLKKLSSNQSR